MSNSDIIRFTDNGRGPTGPGVAAGGTVDQVLTKVSATQYDTEWADPALQDLSSLQPKPAEGQFTDGDKTKLDGIEDGASITRYVEGSTFTASGIVSNAEIWKRCIVNMSGDTTLAITDGVSEGDQIAFVVFNANRDRFVLTDAGAAELNYSNASYILVEMTYLSVSGWQALTFLDSPLTDKGDVMVGIGANEKVHLPVGANTQVLIADSTTATGLKWGTVVANTNANLTGHITSTGNATLLGSFTVAQLNTALSDATLSGNNTGDQDLSPYQTVLSYRATTIDYMLTAGDTTVDVTANSVTIFLPSSVVDKIYVVKNSGAGAVTIDADSGDLIDGASSVTISTQYESLTLQGTGSGWIII